MGDAIEITQRLLQACHHAERAAARGGLSVGERDEAAHLADSGGNTTVIVCGYVARDIGTVADDAHQYKRQSAEYGGLR